MLLAVETSGKTASIAVSDDGLLRGERVLESAGRRHAQTLVSEIDAMLDEQGLGPRDVSQVAVSTGPGSFTGLRVGIVFAKMFAYATGAELLAVETSRVLAEAVPPTEGDLWTVIDAQRGEWFVQRFSHDGNENWCSVEEMSIQPAEEFLRARTETDVLTGPALDRLPVKVADFKCRLADQSVCQPRASALSTLVRRRLAVSDESIVVSPYELRPHYVRKSAAEEKRDAAETKK